jgi:hypothetical protein
MMDGYVTKVFVDLGNAGKVYCIMLMRSLRQGAYCTCLYEKFSEPFRFICMASR